MAMEMNKETNLQDAPKLSQTNKPAMKLHMPVEDVADLDFISEETEDEEASCFQDIAILEGMNGISKTDIEKLKKMGIMTVRGLQTAFTRLELNGMDILKIEKLKMACKKVTSPVAGMCQDGFLTARELCNARRNIFKISTGSRNLDALLGGGIEAASVSEVFGEAASGKTQLCHTLCATAQIPAMNAKEAKYYPGGKIVYIDTENTFRPERLGSIAERFNLDKEKVLDNILYARALNSLHQYELLNAVTARMHAEPGVYKLLIVDSVVALFRADYSSGNGVGVMSHRQQRLYRMMSRLQEIAEEFNIAVLVTNHVTSDCSGVSGKSLLKIGGNSESKPAGGNAVAHSSTTRLGLRRFGIESVRKAKIYGSPELQEKEIDFVIGLGGIDDPVVEEDEDD